jgi:hypothetical protein
VSVNQFFAPSESLTGIGTIDTLAFDSPEGPVFAVPDPLIGNTEIDLALEGNSAVPTDCP